MVRAGDMRFGRGGLGQGRRYGNKALCTERRTRAEGGEDGRGIYSLLDRLSVR